MEELKKGENSSQPLIAKPPDIMSDDRILLAWQRSHMANERTFLAWARTSIALLTFGFMVERFDIFIKHLLHIGGNSVPMLNSGHVMFLSLFSFFLAGFAILFSGFRFLAVRRHINRGEPTYSIVPDMLVVLSVVVIIIITLVMAIPHLFAGSQTWK